MSARSSEPDGSDKRAIPWRLIFSGVLVILIVLFLLENTRSVRISFVGPAAHAPLIVALLIAAALGSLATLLIQRHRARR